MTKRYIDDLTNEEQYHLLQKCKQHQVTKYGQDWLYEVAIYSRKYRCPKCGNRFSRGVSSHDPDGICKYAMESFECDTCNKEYIMLIYPNHKEVFYYSGYISRIFSNLYFKYRA